MERKDDMLNANTYCGDFYKFCIAIVLLLSLVKWEDVFIFSYITSSRNWKPPTLQSMCYRLPFVSGHVPSLVVQLCTWQAATGLAVPRGGVWLEASLTESNNVAHMVIESMGSTNGWRSHHTLVWMYHLALIKPDLCVSICQNHNQRAEQS